MKKFTSRKFIACMAGICGGITLIVTGNVMEGTATIIASVVTYICAEANIDAKAVKDALEDVAVKIEDDYSESGE